MKKKDMRFNVELVQSWIGKNLKKYKCDPFTFTHSVTQIVGLYIEDNVYALTNIQEPVDYFGNIDNMAIFKLAISDNIKIKSIFENVEMIDTPIKDIITGVKLVNEQQTLMIHGKITYEIWLTRAIIIDVGGREISFEKDTTPFSEEIIIRRGYDLLDKVSDNDDFLEEWDDDCIPEYHRQIIEIK